MKSPVMRARAGRAGAGQESQPELLPRERQLDSEGQADNMVRRKRVNGRQSGTESKLLS